MGWDLFFQVLILVLVSYGCAMALIKEWLKGK